MPLQFHASEIRYYYSSIWNHTVLYISNNIRPTRGHMCWYKFSVWPETPLVVPLSSSLTREAHGSPLSSFPSPHPSSLSSLLFHHKLSWRVGGHGASRHAMALAPSFFALVPEAPSPPFWHSSSPLSTSSTTATVAAVFLCLCVLLCWSWWHEEENVLNAMTCFTTSAPLRSWLGKTDLSAVMTPLMDRSLLRSLGCWWQ